MTYSNKKFQDLDVWKNAFSLSLDIHKTSLAFPKIEQYALADQMRRASKSICANIAEGFAKQYHSKPEFKRFLYMAIASANEMLVWVLYAKELGYIAEDIFRKWHDEYDTLCRMINRFISTIK